jgi:RimJ/RimL family protein N-acetyltransferase
MLPDRFGTERLILRPIETGDAGAIFTGYAQDPDVVRFLTFPPHRDRGPRPISPVAWRRRRAAPAPMS